MRPFAAVWVILLCAPLVTAQAVNVDKSNQNTGNLANALQFGGTVLIKGGIGGGARSRLPSEGIASKRTPGGNQNGLDLFTSSAPRLSITEDGRIGIGTTDPSKTVEVRSAGDVELGLLSKDNGGRLWTLQSSGVTGGPLDATFQVIDRTAGLSRLLIDSAGVVSVGVLRITGGADLAEPFATSDAETAPGSVVVIDEDRPGQLTLSTTAYDRRVAGVVSGAGGVRSALTLNQLGNVDERLNVNVALTGRVYVWADATTEAIRPGDLLTTSSTPGHCMKASDFEKAKGAVLGKAMSPLPNGRGLVLALVALQ
jgi:hypothetical protein